MSLREGKTNPWRRWIVRLLAMFGLVVISAQVLPLASWWAYWLSGPFNDPKGEVLIVLGGAPSNMRVLGYSSIVRTRYAGEAFRKDGFQEIVVSGGGDPPLALQMKELLVCSGIPAEKIRTEERSGSTHENAEMTAQLLKGDQRRLVLMTSDYHMYRAIRAFRKAGLNVVPRPIPDARKRADGWRGRLPAFQDVVEETVKIAYYRAKGWI